MPRSIACILLVCLSVACDNSAKPPPVLLPAPSFALTDEAGERFDSVAELGGHVWVANFIFTRCPDVCPAFTAKMASVQEKTASLGDKAPRLISFSVDPQHDTPAVLAAYARQHGARAERWSFLTGETDAVKTAVEGGLKIVMGDLVEKNGLPNIAHGQHFVLVDQRQQIRGYYDMNDAEAFARLLRDIDSIAR
jgi:protein SCO1/2